MNSQEFLFGGHNTRQTEATADFIFPRASGTVLSSVHVLFNNRRKTFATRLVSRGADITDVQHLLGHASVKTTEKAYAAFLKKERFKQTIDLLDQPVMPK